MSSTSKVIVVQRDRRAAAAVRLGFEREGVSVEAPDISEVGDEAVAALIDDDASLVVAGTEGSDAARSLLGALAKGCPAPLLWVGDLNGASTRLGGVKREEAWAAGADEVLAQPAFVRDVVTVGKLIAGRPRGQRQQVSGDLGDYFGVFYLVRALAATGRSGVLTLVRGLRRAEIRFFEGEVTSASMGALHGQAGLHQLLLWTEARFEWRHEPVVRRRQIPLEHHEVLSQAERFLSEIRNAAGGLSPSTVYEQDVSKIQALAKKLPTEVHGVLRLFDANRTFADVLEDSPFRVFETLRVAMHAVEVGLLRKVETQRPKAARRAALALDEWLVGNESKDAVIDRAMAIPDTAPGPKVAEGAVGGKKKNKGKRRAQSVPPVAPPEIDWAALVPRASNVDMSAITGVVPASQASGEIDLAAFGSAIAARREGREGLEALTSDQRSAMFPTGTVEVAEQSTVDSSESTEESKVEGSKSTEESKVESSKSKVAEPEPAPEPVVAVAPAPEPVVEAKPEPVPVVEAKPEPATEPIALVEPEPEPVVEAKPEPVVEAKPEPVVPVVPVAPAVAEPSVLGSEPPNLRTSELPNPLPDLAAAHAAVAAVAERETVREKPLMPDARDAATSGEIAATRKEIAETVAHAASFTDDEEEFFRAGRETDKQPRAAVPDNFDDLDEGFRPVTFWERLLGDRKPRK